MLGYRFPTNHWLLAGQVLALAICSLRVSADIIHVPADFPTIQAAIDAATDGDEVVIAPDTYTGSQNRDLDFTGKAITVRSTDPNDPDVVAATIIDCQQAGRGFIFQSEETLESVVDGLTVVNGFATDGAGVYLVNGSSATIKNCVFTGNTVPISSGVFFSDNAPTQRADLVIINCTISDNLGGGFAAFAIENLTVTGSIISGNSGTAIDTGFPFSPFPNLIVRNSTIVDNDGGGITTNQATTIELANCTVADNGGTGVVAFEVASGSGVMITNCTITGNTSDEGTGGLRCEASTSAVIRNCLISNNTGRVGGGLDISGFAAFEITGCTFAGNVSTEFGGGGIRTSGTDPVAIRNCILWGNAAPEGPQLLLDSGFNDPSVVSVDFSTVEGGEKGVFVDEACCSPSHLIWGVGNIDVDPQFVDPENADKIYFLSVRFSVSVDGGRSLVPNPPRGGGDTHDIWIDPTNPKRIMVGDDVGNTNVSLDGQSFRNHRLPVAQMYHVAVDDDVPYNVYGNRQDGYSYRGPSNSRAGS
ncbi:MAG: right-handed parallel beta-helix repeat-containing protein, partial [Planctomycetes bacterium]|nr:right-handed parallel beta-helix repeat-containing protein [Planctomycetota bacterium]